MVMLLANSLGALYFLHQTVIFSAEPVLLGQHTSSLPTVTSTWPWKGKVFIDLNWNIVYTI